MTKQNGLGDQLLVGGVNLSNDIGAVEISCPHGVFISTGLDKLAVERLLARKDGRIAVDAYFNPSAGASHDTLNNLPSTDVQTAFLHTTTRGKPAVELLAKQANYDGTRGADGQLGFKAEFLGNGFPTEWGNQLTAGSDVLTGAAAGPGVDFTAATAFGLQAYLHVLAFTGTSATVTIQDNTADVAGTYADVTGAGFAAASAIGAQRIQTSRTQAVRRWVRYNVTGTFSALTLAVIIAKNDTTVNF